VVSIFIVPNNTQAFCRFSYLNYMMNAFLLLPNKTYEHYLISVIQNTRTLVMDVWQELEWTDPRFTWNDEPQNLRLPMSEIWTPDIVLYNRWVKYVLMSLTYPDCMYMTSSTMVTKFQY
jgi:hypothetical protein